MIQKLELLRSLIDNEIMMQRAEKLGLLASDADVKRYFVENYENIVDLISGQHTRVIGDAQIALSHERVKTDD